jgi:hypothetical protein
MRNGCDSELTLARSQSLLVNEFNNRISLASMVEVEGPCSPGGPITRLRKATRQMQMCPARTERERYKPLATLLYCQLVPNIDHTYIKYIALFTQRAASGFPGAAGYRDK